MAKNKSLDLTPEQRELRELEAHERREKLMTYMKSTGHGIPKTRREFLGSGLLAGLGYIAAPSILELVMRSGNAQAQSNGELKCPDDAPAAARMMPFVHVNLSGGAALMGTNFVVHDANGDLLPSYSILGLGSPNNFQIVREFGNVPFATQGTTLISTFLQGVREGAANPTANNTPTAINNTAFVGVCVRSIDDTDSNALSPLGLVSASGLVGSSLPNLGTRGGQSNSGVGQNFATVRGPAPLIVNNFAAISSAFAPTGSINTQLNTPEMRTSLFQLVQNLSNSQKQMLAASSSSATLSKLVECATTKNVALISSNNNGVDPRANAAVATTWNLAANNNVDLVRASLVYNALNGIAGGVGIEMGGYDYHGGGRANQIAQDTNAGRVVGRILRTAEIMQQPVFIYVTSDGSVNSVNSQDPGSAPIGDRGSAGGSYMIVYRPTGRPQTNGFQLGSFGVGQAADESIVPNWNSERSSLAVFANYLKLNNKLAMLDTIANRPFDAGQLTRILKF